MPRYLKPAYIRVIVAAAEQHDDGRIRVVPRIEPEPRVARRENERDGSREKWNQPRHLGSLCQRPPFAHRPSDRRARWLMTVADTMPRMRWLPILEYRDFYDVPRLVLVRVGGRFLLLDSPFDDILDDYAPEYDVFEFTDDPRPFVGPDWRSLPSRGRHLGRVPVASITFDRTRRLSIRSDGLAAYG